MYMSVPQLNFPRTKIPNADVIYENSKFFELRIWVNGPQALVGTTNNGYYLFLIVGYILKLKFLTEIFDPSSIHPYVVGEREFTIT